MVLRLCRGRSGRYGLADFTGTASALRVNPIKAPRGNRHYRPTHLFPTGVSLISNQHPIQAHWKWQRRMAQHRPLDHLPPRPLHPLRQLPRLGKAHDTRRPPHPLHRQRCCLSFHSLIPLLLSIAPALDTLEHIHGHHQGSVWPLLLLACGTRAIRYMSTPPH